ncbi:hypothetical protein MRX96_024223 [Rhipicephalus microplus]
MGNFFFSASTNRRHRGQGRKRETPENINESPESGGFPAASAPAAKSAAVQHFSPAWWPSPPQTTAVNLNLDLSDHGARQRSNESVGRRQGEFETTVNLSGW